MSMTRAPHRSPDPDWFDAWFDDLFPEEDGPTYPPKYIWLTLDWNYQRVYRAIRTGELMALRVTPTDTYSTYEVPREALRAWLLSMNTVELAR